MSEFNRSPMYWALQALKEERHLMYDGEPVVDINPGEGTVNGIEVFDLGLFTIGAAKDPSYVLMNSAGKYMVEVTSRGHGGPKEELRPTSDINRATVFRVGLPLVVRKYSVKGLIQINATETRKVTLCP